MGNYKTLKEEVYEANMQLPRLGLVLYSFGNASAVDRNKGVFGIKPSGVPYAELRPEDVVICDFNGKPIDGNRRPSSDTKTHAVLYKEYDAIGGVVHTHSTYATAWAQALKDIPVFGTTHADYLITDIPCALPMKDDYIQGDYEHMTGYQIFDCLKERKLDYKEVQMILVGSHGPFTWGTTVGKAVYHSAVCEEVAKMAYLTLQINPDALPLKDTLKRKHFDRKHGKDAYYGQGCR
ncbi:L-ribulose-5-phosphate 4-epimerase AraD [Flavobacteriaceae bacterium TP-CH-4]|uniref:L-ribulose-5-phosphate 4-epimerase n=1 Tax=Pelagihabitans pacificus TaxID=2696054 RepID=A0A967AXN4_9FLAO|nr:L-ribulose-5-phosphate 4-epimerase AraD [Pelagihabitans pacificus]NHF58481.1 L-ribulose-5-phosphate 4-epimerase AraD [Pelagihabitans pacificus]